MSGLDSQKENSTTKVGGCEDEQCKVSTAGLNKGKVYFRQKCMTFEKQSETLQEIVKFRELLEEHVLKQEPPMSAIPEEHLPLIAKLAHENDKTLAALSKQIRQELLPTADENINGGAGSMLPSRVVEAAIQAVAERKNYGLDGFGGNKPPAAVCVWRWEVKDQCWDWLPKNALEKAESRRTERIHAKQELLKAFETLSQDQRDTILTSKGGGKLSRKETNVAGSSKTPDSAEEKHSPQNLSKQKKRPQEGDDPDNAKSAATPTQAGPIKIIKDHEKLEKKAAKDIKEKKEKEAHEKSRFIMASFFAKPKKAPGRDQLQNMNPGVAGPSSIKSDFEKSFKPFALKRDAQLAPVNWFIEAKERKKPSSGSRTDNDVIIIDDVEDSGKADISNNASSPTTEDVANLNTTDHLRSILSPLPRQANYPKRHLSSSNAPRLKTHNPLSVRDIFSQLTEAEVVGDDTVVRLLISKLNDRSILPAKVLIFHEDARPGYYGTWTRNSRIIGPRTPLARDVIAHDYGYDSGEDWEPEPTSDVEDIAEDGEDEDDEDAESDTDSWLVDDDDEGRGFSVEALELSPMTIPDLPLLPSKRKAEDEEKAERMMRRKRKKVVVPLVPFSKGASWETTIGCCEYRLFDSYKIHLFNDTPFPIDPFTFVSTCVEDSKQRYADIPPDELAINDHSLVLPSLLDHSNEVTKAIPVQPLQAPSPAISQPSHGGKKSSHTLKNPFPDAYLPFLLEKINSLQTGSITFLIEAIYRDLREHNVKKNMIESKVREVGEKCREKKLWVVKSGIRVPT